MAKHIKVNTNEDKIDRRGFLECMAWAGTGMLWTVGGGIPTSTLLGQSPAGTGFTFAQISDSHIGFNKDANKDVSATLQEAIAKINALEITPDLLIHTGDISHLSKASEFDTHDEILKSAKIGQAFFVPGEHDMIPDNGAQYLSRYGKQAKGSGWYSFDHKGVHFVALVNVANLKPGGLGSLGTDQLDWLSKDLQGLSASTPVVVFAHIPLWTVYPDWGWGTDDSAQALSYLKRFGSVTVLNGHIHQTMQKIEGNVSFHTARSTAFPQPAPGSAPSPGPMKVPADQLRSVLGITQVSYVAGSNSLAIVDSSLQSSAPADSSTTHIGIDNFSFTPKTLRIATGSSITWTNHDDIPHNVESNDHKFSSPVLDTGQTFDYKFTSPGAYPYYCKLHPSMTATIQVEG